MDRLRGMTLGRMLSEHAAHLGDKTCLIFQPNGERYSWRELDTLTNRVANAMRQRGIRHGSHVAVMTENRLEQIISYFALAKLGAVSVPVNPAAKGYFLERFIGHSDSVAIIIEPEFLGVLADVSQDVPQLATVFVFSSLESPGKALDVPAGLQHLSVSSFDDLKQGESAAVDEAQPLDLAQIMYTSGTTGPSKGSMFCHTAILNWADKLSAAHGIGSGDIFLVVFPLFHGGAWFSSTMTTLWRGGTVAVGRRFSASRFFEQANSVGATASLLVGVAGFVAAQRESTVDQGHSLRKICCAPPPPNPIEFEQRFKVKLTSAFGLSDFCVSHALGPDAPAEKIGSGGTLLPDVEVKVVDDAGDAALPGIPGELLLRNNTPGGSASGYYKMPEETLKSRADLWFHTGDVVSIDADGYLYFVDRKKDAIRRRGENISSIELEMVLGRHELVDAVAFFPVQASDTEDEVAVAIIRTPGSALDEAAVVQYCERHMPRYAVPRFIQFVDAFPLTGSGKVQKVKLRAAAEADRSALWDRIEHGDVAASRRLSA